MKTFLTLAALAATVTCQFDDKSPPFRLVLESSNSTLNGTVLGACHEGAGIEALCYTDTPVTDKPDFGTTFYYNFSASETNGTDIDVTGSLNWDLHTSQNQFFPSTMDFSYDPSSNIAIPIFSPGEYPSTYVSFDACNAMYIASYTDDTTNPPVFLNTPAKLENWYVCSTRYSYSYDTLSWKVGVVGVPQNPSCQKTRVKRVWNRGR